MKTLLPGMLALVIAWVAIPACSDENDQPDGAVDAGQDAGEDAGADPGHDAGSDPGADPGADPGSDPGTDAGWDAGTLPDHDPQSSFLLIIPPGTGLNTVFCEGRTWQDEYQMQGRIDLVPGVYVLPRTEAPLDVDMVESVFFGPEHITAQATGPGSFDVDNRYAWYYFYRQDFLLANEPYHLDVTILFDPFYWGPEWPAQVIMEGEFAATFVFARSMLGAGTMGCRERQGFSFHDLSSMSGADHLGTTAGGDHVLVEVRHARACRVAGNTGCEETNHAELSLGGVQRVITDPGALFYSAGHHNMEQKYLLLLDDPIGNTAAVLVEAPIMSQTEGGSLVKLDDSMTPVVSEPFVDWQTTYP